MKRKGLLTIFLCAFFMLCNIFLTSLNFNVSASAEINEKSSPITNITSEDTEWESNYKTYVSFDSSKTHFANGENITVTYTANSDNYISDVSYTHTGFSVNYVCIDPSNSNRILVSLSCIPDADEYSMFITITLSSGETLTAMLYATVNEYGAFISPFSEDDALERYFDFAKESNIMTQAEYETIKVELSRRCIVKEKIIETTAESNARIATYAATAEETYLVGGTLQWIDDLGNFHPLRRVMVELYDRDIIGSTYVGTTYTDNYGNYSFTFDHNDNIFENGGADFFVRVYAGDSNALVKNSNCNNYYIESNVYENVSIGSFLEISFGIDMSTDTGKAFQISQAILTARDYAWNMMGEMPEDVTVIYPIGNRCEYNDSSKKIKITGNAPESTSYPNSYASWDVIMHEYGHHIQYHVEIINYPDVDSHSSFLNDADTLGNKDQGIRLAWAESWPTVFGLLAQDYYSVYLSNIDKVCNTHYESYNGLDYNIETTTVTKGEACERSIMAVLWDLYDGANDEDVTNDTISLTHEQYWAVTTGNQSKTFSNFISYFYSVYPEYVDDIGYNLTYYNMATTVPTMVNLSVLAEDTPPCFSWDAQGGSETVFNNNNFTLIFYGVSENEILRTQATTSTTYTLTQDEWTTIINNCGGYFTVAVSAMQMHEPVTGQYISQRSDIFGRYNIHFHSYTDNYEQLSDNEHRAFCSCGLNRVEKHTYNVPTNSSSTEHRLDCACGHEGTKTESHCAHSYSSMNNMRHYIYCECGHYIGTGTHTMVTTGRYATCTLCYVRVDTFSDITIKGTGDNETVGQKQ